MDDEAKDLRFFSEKKTERENSLGDDANKSKSLVEADSDELGNRRCLTFRFLSKLFPCIRGHGVWEPSQGDIFKSQEVEETKYPKILTLLENPVVDIIFVLSCLLSIFLLIFAEGFLMKSKSFWAIVHCKCV